MKRYTLNQKGDVYELPELVNIQFSILATAFMRDAKNDPHLAHQMAWEFLKVGYDYLRSSPPASRMFANQRGAPPPTNGAGAGP
jgi:hypothetical protein